MNIINYSITIELTMDHILRFPVRCDMKQAEKYFYEHKFISKSNKEKDYYSKALIILRHAQNYGASLSCISSLIINKECICRFSFSFTHLEGLQMFKTAVSC